MTAFIDEILNKVERQELLAMNLENVHNIRILELQGKIEENKQNTNEIRYVSI
jgi:hypothetical protein